MGKKKSKKKGHSNDVHHERGHEPENTEDRKFPDEENGNIQTGEGDDSDPLKAIYHDDSGKTIDMTTLERKKMSRATKALVIFGGLSLAAGAAAAGFFLFNPDQTPNNSEEASLTFGIPDSISSGDEIAIAVTAENKNRVDWMDVELILRFPEGFTFVRSDLDPSNDFHNSWSLGRIEGYHSKTLRVTGQLIGEIGSTHEIEATIVYTPSNFRSEFKKIAKADLEISDSILVLTVNGPDKVAKDQEIVGSATVENRSDTELSNVAVKATLPAGFHFFSSDPELKDESKPEWIFEKIKPGEIKKMLIRGTVDGKNGESKEFIFQSGILENDNRMKLSQQASFISFFIHPELNLSFSLNGSNEDQVVRFGDRLEYVLDIENVSDLLIRDVKVVLNLDGLSESSPVRLLDWERVEGVVKNQISDSTITWTKERLELFKEMKQNDKAKLRFSIPLIQENLESLQTMKNFRVLANAKIASFQVDEFENLNMELKSKELTAKIGTSFELRSEARYFSDEFEQVGSGPLPPKVSEKTTVEISFFVNNSINDISNVFVSASLPSLVEFEKIGSNGAGSLSFQKNSQTVSWKIKNLPAHTGTISETAIATFFVSVTPTEDDIGKSLPLLLEASASARDDWTNENVSDASERLTTELTNDLQAQGKGIVIQ